MTSTRTAPRRPAAGYLFIAPFMIVFVAMLVVPLAYAGYLSLFRSSSSAAPRSSASTTTCAR
ncbi:hypothetical protein ACFQ0B_50820 [Nonomuraea thailandensis]